MRTFLAILIVVSVVVPALGSGMAHNEDFVVLAPDQSLADDVLAKAVALRRELAREWLDEELPPSVGRIAIHVEISDSGEDRGLFWPIDSPGRTLHKLWMTTSRQSAVGSTLEHEMTHAVLATRFDRRLPAWCDEGAASLRDDAERIRARGKILQWYARTGNWPNLTSTLEAATISSDDRARYSVAASVTEFLLTKGTRATFLQFALDVGPKGCDDALAAHYDLKSVAELQSQWQAWVATSDARPQAPTDSGRPGDTR